jgi:hypothetical protein
MQDDCDWGIQSIFSDAHSAFDLFRLQCIFNKLPHKLLLPYILLVYNNVFDRLARIAALAKARSVDPALISTDVGSNPSECMLELASGITQIKYAISINRDIDRLVSPL